MVGQVINKKVDSKHPASLSNRYITGILRQKLGYKGVIISDDLKMRAIKDNWSLSEAILLAINAGNDIIIYSNNLGEYNLTFVKDAIAIIKKDIFEGKISEDRINESYLRILMNK